MFTREGGKKFKCLCSSQMQVLVILNIGSCSVVLGAIHFPLWCLIKKLRIVFNPERNQIKWCSSLNASLVTHSGSNARCIKLDFWSSQYKKQNTCLHSFALLIRIAGEVFITTTYSYVTVFYVNLALGWTLKWVTHE